MIFIPHVRCLPLFAQIVPCQCNAGDHQILTIFDSAAGSSSLLLNVGQQAQNSSLVSYYSQELNIALLSGSYELNAYVVPYDDMYLYNDNTLIKIGSLSPTYLTLSSCTFFTLMTLVRSSVFGMP